MDEEMFRKARKEKIKARFNHAMRINRITQQYNDSKESIESARKSLKTAIQQNDLGMIRSILTTLQQRPTMMKALGKEIGKAARALESGENALIRELREASDDHGNPEQETRLRGAVDGVTEAGISEPADLISEAEDTLMKLQHLNKLRKMIEDLNQKTIAEIKSYKKPMEDIIHVMRAVLLAIGTPPGEIKDWEGCRLWIGKTGKMSLKRRIKSLDYSILSSKPKTLKIVKYLVNKVRVEKIQAISKGAAVFYAWICGVLLEIDPSFAAS